MSHINYILKSAFIIFSASLIARVLGYITKIIIARNSQEIYGLYSLGNSLVLFLVPLVLLGLNIGLSRYLGFYIGKNQKKKADMAISTALKIVIPLSILSFLVVFFFSGEISQLFKTENMALTLRVFSMLIPLTALSYLFFSILTANKKIKQLVFARDLLQGALEVIFILVAVYIGFSIKSVAFAFILAVLITLIVVYNKNRFSFQLKGFDKPLVNFSISALIIFVFIDMITRIDTLILAHYVNINEVATYNVAVPTAQMILIFSISLLTVFLPSISERHAQRKSINKEYKSVTKWTLILTYPGAILMILFSTKIIEVLFGQKYLSASIPLSILSFSLFLLSLSRPAYNVLLMLKKTKLLIKMSTGVILLDVVLNFALVNLMIHHNIPGMYGSAIATGLSIILLSTLTSYFAYIHTKIKILGKNELKIILSGIIAITPLVIIKLLAKNESLIHLIVYLIIFCIIYLTLLIKTRCFDKTDRDLLSLIKNRFAKK